MSDTIIKERVETRISEHDLQNISRRYQMGSETIHALREVTLTIQRGDAVMWQNQDTASHTATRDEDPKRFDTGSLDTGETSQPVVFADAGTFEYTCLFHATMRGTIIVT